MAVRPTIAAATPTGAGQPAAAASGTDYSTWIAVDPADATATADSGSIMTSATMDAGTKLTTFVIAGSGSASAADWIFDPVDSAGDSIDLTGYDLIFHVVWTTQPSAGSDISLSFYHVDGTTKTSFFGFGAHWDSAGSGPDLINYGTGIWSASSATTADGSAVTIVKLPAPMWEAASARYEPVAGGFSAWMRNPGTFGVDKVKFTSNTNKTLGTTSSNINWGMTIGEGNSAETISAKIFVRAVPTIAEVAP